MSGFSVELKYPIQNSRATRMSGDSHALPHSDVAKYLRINNDELISNQLSWYDYRGCSHHMKKGSQHAINVPRINNKHFKITSRIKLRSLGSIQSIYFDLSQRTHKSTSEHIKTNITAKRANKQERERGSRLLLNSELNLPIIIPNVLAALCSRFILIKCLSFVGVCSDSTSCIVSVFDDPDPLSSPLFDGPQVECRCISIALPCRMANCFSCRFASLNIAKYVNTIIVHGIQNDTELDTTAYTLLTSKRHSFGFSSMNFMWSSVVYHPVWKSAQSCGTKQCER